MKEGIDDDDLFKSLANITKMDGLANFDPNVNSTLFDVDSLLEEDGFSGNRRKASPSSYGSSASASRTSLGSPKIRNSSLSWLEKNDSGDRKKKETSSKKTKATVAKAANKNLQPIGESVKSKLKSENKPNEATQIKPEQKNLKNDFASNLDDILGEMDELTNTKLPQNSESDVDSISNMFDDRNEKSRSGSDFNVDDDEIDSIEAALDDLKLDDELTTPIVESLVCRACGETITSGPACRITKGVYHVAHFACVECNGSLLNKPFYERLDKLYCINDYIRKFAHLCEVCKEPVLNDIILSLGLYYHMEHFKCRICDGVIGDKPYHLVNKVQHCIQCFEQLYSKSCEFCNKSISGNHVSVKGKFWHSDCFKCVTCEGKLENGSFQLHQNKLYCINDYHRLQGTICLTCNQPIVGRCVQSKGRYYHAEHFVCNLCKTPLASKSYKILNDREYCTNCFDISYTD